MSDGLSAKNSDKSTGREKRVRPLRSGEEEWRVVGIWERGRSSRSVYILWEKSKVPKKPEWTKIRKMQKLIF